MAENDDSLRMTPIETLYTTDFSGKATISVGTKDRVNADLKSLSFTSHIEGAEAGEFGIPLDIFVQSMDFQLGEHHITSEYQGNYFGSLYFGKSPIVVNVVAYLLDNSAAHGKQALLEYYKNKLRLTAVANTGVLPRFTLKGYDFAGPWFMLRITESARSEDVLAVVFSFLALTIHGTGSTSSFYLDFTHGGRLKSGDAVSIADMAGSLQDAQILRQDGSIVESVKNNVALGVENTIRDSEVAVTQLLS